MTTSNEVASTSPSVASAALDASPPQSIPGHRLVLGLFVILAICVATMFTLFALSVRPEDREWLPTMLFRYLYMPVVATSLIVSIDAKRRARTGWWLYLVTAPVPGLNMVLAALWLLKWRHGDPVGRLQL